eukprot:scaffold1671_cov159-Amphora_coffeaeformis.AAC.2
MAGSLTSVAHTLTLHDTPCHSTFGWCKRANANTTDGRTASLYCNIFAEPSHTTATIIKLFSLRETFLINFGSFCWPTDVEPLVFHCVIT